MSPLESADEVGFQKGPLDEFTFNLALFHGRDPTDKTYACAIPSGATADQVIDQLIKNGCTVHMVKGTTVKFFH